MLVRLLLYADKIGTIDSNKEPFESHKDIIKLHQYYWVYTSPKIRKSLLIIITYQFKCIHIGIIIFEYVEGREGRT